MGHQTFPVFPVREGWADGNRRVGIVGQEISEIYDKVASLGGVVVGEHTVVADFAPSLGAQPDGILFIVAKIPKPDTIPE